MAVGINSMSADERQQFEYLNDRQVAYAMFYNLCEGYNQAETAAQNNVFGDRSRQQTVSLIMRAYGFSNRNAGKFRKIGASYEDVLAYVRKYPHGYTGIGNDGPQIMADFLKNRVNGQTPKWNNETISRPKSVTTDFAWSKSNNNTNSNRYRNSNININSNKNRNINSNSNSNNNTDGDVEPFVGVFFSIGLFCAALLLRWYINGTLWGKWYRKVFTVIAVIFSLGTLGIFSNGTEHWSKIKKIAFVITSLVALGLDIYAVCAFSGHMILRILAGLFGIAVSYAISDGLVVFGSE